MWKCPKCGKEFKNRNQSHYCGEKPKTIEEYINHQDAEKQADLFLIRQTLQQALPEAEERISWSMPTLNLCRIKAVPMSGFLLISELRLGKHNSTFYERKPAMTNEKIYSMSFAKLYPLLLAKVEKKGRTSAEVDAVACWLTGYSTERLHELMESDLTYGDFFLQVPQLNPNRRLIKGVVCGQIFLFRG